MCISEKSYKKRSSLKSPWVSGVEVCFSGTRIPAHRPCCPGGLPLRGDSGHLPPPHTHLQSLIPRESRVGVCYVLSVELAGLTSLAAAAYGTNLITQGLGDAVDLGVQGQKHEFGGHTAVSATLLLKHRFSSCREPLRFHSPLQEFRGPPQPCSSH